MEKCFQTSPLGFVGGFINVIYKDQQSSEIWTELKESRFRGEKMSKYFPKIHETLQQQTPGNEMDKCTG